MIAWMFPDNIYQEDSVQIQKILFLFLIILLPLACQTAGVKPDAGQMSFEQARDVVLSMQSIPLSPPPRKLDDILAILEQPENQNADITELFQRADSTVPAGRPSVDMYHFYKSRANARYELYRFQAAAADIRQAIAYGEQTGIRESFLYRRLAKLEMQAGRYEAAFDLSEKALLNLHYAKWRFGPYLGFQSRILTRMGQFTQAADMIERAYQHYREVPAAARYSYIVHGGERDIGNENDILEAEAELLETQGLYTRAHEKRVRVLSYKSQMRHKRPIEAVYAELDLATNFRYQGRLVEAEKEARWAVKHAVGIYGRQSGITAAALQTLGEVLLAKGDLDNAKILVAAQKDILAQLRLAKEEDVMVRARMFHAAVLCADYDFAAAMAAYQSALDGMQANVYLYGRYARRNTSLILVLIENRQIRAARVLIRETRDDNQSLKINSIYKNAELTALEALILYQEEKTEAARANFAKAVPGLMAILQEPGSDFEMRRRADLLLNRYIELLLDFYQHESDQAGRDNLVEELFRLADARQSRVNSALGESSARAASLTDPQLAELVRQEQDADKRIKSLKAAYYNAAAAAGGESNSALTALGNNIHALTAARTSILARIASEFPKYTGYVKPQPPSIEAVQAQLGATEAFLTIWTLEEKTCVWMIPPTGKPGFAVVDLGHQALAAKVSRLRRALKPDARLLSDIPEFDTGTAYSLYTQLLAPLAPAWQGATDLIVVVKGPLDQLPLGLLPTAPVSPSKKDAVRFESYRAVPWLIKRVSLTRLPSTAALLTLRTLPAPAPGREAFAGFGDPIFNPAQLEAAGSPPEKLARRGHGGNAIQIRGIRVSEEGGLDDTALTSVGLEQLNRLPDTAAEIRDIADNLGADTSRDIYLGAAASETNVKTTDLSKKRIVAFATHALLPGDLDGLAQPALAFSSPDVTGNEEDGLLTMGEVLSLKLDADLVVLSACDTGAADQAGSEAVSGLGRAFFYSGARALLVTMWPVETSSAHKLTTGLFRWQARENSRSWARALQRSMLALMDDPGLRHPDGTVVARYAHPLFWGSFVVVGDSGHR
jgi:CHAT domain-containing protein